MLTVISPAKTLDFESPTGVDSYTIPAHLSQSRKLVRRLRELSADDLKDLMRVSDNIAELNHQRCSPSRGTSISASTQPA